MCFPSSAKNFVTPAPPPPPPPPTATAAVVKPASKRGGATTKKRRGTAQLTRPSIGGTYSGSGVNLPK